MDWTPANPSKSWDGAPWALGAGAGETCSMGIRVQLDWLCTDSLDLRPGLSMRWADHEQEPTGHKQGMRWREPAGADTGGSS